MPFPSQALRLAWSWQLNYWVSYNSNEDTCPVLWFDTFSFIFVGKQLVMGMQALWNLDLRFLFLLKKFLDFTQIFHLKFELIMLHSWKKKNVTEHSEWCAITSEKNISCWKNIFPPTDYNTHSSAYFILHYWTMQSSNNV